MNHQIRRIRIFQYFFISNFAFLLEIAEKFDDSLSVDLLIIAHIIQQISHFILELVMESIMLRESFLDFRDYFVEEFGLVKIELVFVEFSVLFVDPVYSLQVSLTKVPFLHILRNILMLKINPELIMGQPVQ